MYRYAKIEVGGAADSSLTAPAFGPLKAFIEQTLDREHFSTTRLVGTSDVEASVAIAPVSTAYFVAIFADYPVMVRLNDVAGTQFTLKTNGRAVVNAGSPAPPQCFAVMTAQCTAIYLAPIASAAQTATVQIVVTGDPLNSYT